MKNKVSVIITIPNKERIDPITELYKEYKKAISASKWDYEFIYIISYQNKNFVNELINIKYRDGAKHCRRLTG